MGTGLLLALLLGFFAYSLAHSQQQQRRDLEKRFHDRADVSAAVTEAIFGSAGSQTQVQNAARFGGATIDPAALARTAEQSQSQYVAIVASDGRVLAATRGAPRRALAAAPDVAKALTTGSIQLSNLLPSAGGSTVIESASPFPTVHGRRVELTAATAELQRAELSRMNAIEINDNVVQRLVVAKYALDRGATESSQAKLSETLREAQQLVTSLLEEKDIGPGVLRRAGAAPTDRPPEPSGSRPRERA